MFLKRDTPYALIVGMTGVKMGDRLLHVGCPHGARMAAVAAKVGLSGRVVVVAPDESAAAQARKGAAAAGVLVDLEVAPPTKLPVDQAAFDLVVVDDTAGLLGAAGPEERVASIREVQRALRGGGRVMIIGAAPRSGLAGILPHGPDGPPFVASGGAGKALEADGFTSVRILATREGLVFLEGIKPR